MAAAPGTIDRVIEIATRELGYTEKPRNVVKYWPAIGLAPYNQYNAAWCGGFVYWVLDTAGVKVPWTSPTAFAYTPTGVRQARAAGLIVSTPKPGDIVFFDWQGDATVDHVGIVTDASRWKATGIVTTIEGNTSPGTAGSQSDGGGVYRRTRHRSTVAAFARPKYVTVSSSATPKPAQGPAPKLSEPSPVRAVQAGCRVTVDGEWGPKTDSAVRAVRGVTRGTTKGISSIKAAQRAAGVTADGIVGPKTRAALTATVRKLQTAFGVSADGVWGPKTETAYIAARKKHRQG